MPIMAECLRNSLILTIIVGLCSFLLTNNLLITSVFMFGAFNIVMLHYFSTRCSRCGHLGVVSLYNTDHIDTRQNHSRFSRPESVGSSVQRNRYGEVMCETTHYMDVEYVKTTTTATYENTYLCNNCGAMTKKQFQKQTSETHRY